MPAPITDISIDIETRATVDLKRTGVYRYVECPDFRVLVICYSVRREGSTRWSPVRELDLTDTVKVARFRKHLRDTGVRKHAFNAAFERVCLSAWMGMPVSEYLDPEGWYCTAVRAAVGGVQGTLDEIAKHVRAVEKKDAEGSRLIRMFSRPRTARSGGGFNEMDDPEHRDEAERFRDYCKQDVRTEQAVAARMPEVPDDVMREYWASERVNDTGVRIDRALAEAAIGEVKEAVDALRLEMRMFTGVDNPNSNPQLLAWVTAPAPEGGGYPKMTALNKQARAEALADPECPSVVRSVLDLKARSSLSSVAKYNAALEMVCSDDRIRGMFRFYGAHTGRWAGRGPQPQNLPNSVACPTLTRMLVDGLCGTAAPEAAKRSVRSMFIPRDGHVFVQADYSAIEARVLAWLAGEDWVLDVFRGDGRIYEATAAMMFGLDKDTIAKTSTERKLGKVAELGAGYGGGAGALIVMGAEEAGIDCGNYKELHAEWVASEHKGKFWEYERDRHDYPELIELRDRWRDARPATVRFWKLIARAFDTASESRRRVLFRERLVFEPVGKRHIRLVLPSGRAIWYRFPKVVRSKDNPDYTEARFYLGKGQGVGYSWIETHGGKLTENITQAVARDVLTDLLLRVEARGWRTVMHVHDEIVLEVPEEEASTVLDDLLGMMKTLPEWASGLPMQGDGELMERYGK